MRIRKFWRWSRIRSRSMFRSLSSALTVLMFFDLLQWYEPFQSVCSWTGLVHFCQYRFRRDVARSCQWSREALGLGKYIHSEKGLLYITLFNNHPFIRDRQAALCALRVIKKVPDLADHFVNKAKNLLTDRNHGVLLTTITLVSEIIQVKTELLDEFRNVCVLPIWFASRLASWTCLIIIILRQSLCWSEISNLSLPRAIVRSTMSLESQIPFCKSRFSVCFVY